MTVIFSKKCELAIQAVLFLSIQQSDHYFNSGDISKELKVPKEFVSKVLQTLTFTGIVGSKKGKSGGFFLEKDPSHIRLVDIVQAIDGLDVFENCCLGFPGCSPVNPCPVHYKWGRLRDDAFKMLTDETLSELRDATIKKIKNL
jgi:Rrf2 family transcriptional regulator, iron-sulfur cluster assembly transcription factor